jgi:hypothetical protein
MALRKERSQPHHLLVRQPEKMLIITPSARGLESPSDANLKQINGS